MKQLLFLFVLLVTSHIGFSQCIMLKVDLNDCIVCRSTMLKVRPGVTGLPAYVVFPEQSRADSADIDFAGRFSVSKIEMRFSDSWYHRLDSIGERSQVFGINRFGAIAYKHALSDLDSIGLSAFIASNQPSVEKPTGSTYIYRDSLEFIFDDALSRLTILNRFTQKKITTIKSSTFDLKNISDQLTGIEKQKFDKYGRQINTGITAFLASFKDFRLLDDTTILLCYMYHNTPDSISTSINDKLAFLEYSLGGKLKKVHMVDMPSNIVVYITDFIASGNKLFMPFWTLDEKGSSEPKNWDRVNYIAQFKLKNGRFTFEAPVDYNIPWYYRKRKMYDFLSLGSSSYPYVTSYLGNEIVNISTGKIINIIPDSLFKRTADIATDPKSYNSSTASFQCYELDRDKKGNQISVLYNFENNLRINWYSTNLDLISSSSIVYDFIPGAELFWASAYPEINSIKMRIKTKSGQFRQYFLPMDLFH